MSKKRACDSRCHNAKGEKCLCWCGGAFHGAGKAQARDKFIEDIKTGIQVIPPFTSFSPEKNVNISSNVKI